LRKAVGSYIWIAPEQIVGVRGDPRSDVFAIGAMLYEMCTGDVPFGNPQTRGGLRQRMWMQPRLPRQLNSAVPEWLQEIILRCLQPQAENRYESAALLAFDLTHPQQVKITERGKATTGAGFWLHLRRWLAGAAANYQPSPLLDPISQPPIVMVAVPYQDATEAVLEALRQAVKRTLGNRPGARLSCVSVISPVDTSQSEVLVHQKMMTYLRHWAANLELGNHVATYHVIESSDVAQALLTYADGNQVNLIIMGAATHGLQIQRFVATVPIKVAMHAPCTVMLVKA
jgi:eukaryotic-like serine/threonine-protein kinase